MTTIYFVRHAEPNFSNHDDATRELTVKGLEDCKLVTEYLSDKKIDIALSSPYKRSVDTIKNFADTFNLAISTIDDFRERTVDSVWVEDFATFSKRQWEDFNYKLTGGESLHEVQNRNISALLSVLKKYANTTIIIGSHGTSLSTIINYYDTSFGFADFYKIKSLMPWVVKFTFENAECLKIEQIDLPNKNTNAI